MTFLSKISESAFGRDRFTRSEWMLMLFLMVLAFVPGINDLVLTRMASGEGILNILGQMEWFDTINETILAFLVLPLYNLLSSVREDHDLLRGRISQVFLVGFVLYVLFSSVVFIQASSLTEAMGAPAESVDYLRLTTIGFVLDYLVQVSLVILVVIGKEMYVGALIVSKVAMLVVLDIILMENFSYMGAAMSAVLCNVLMVAVSLLSIRKEGLIQLRPVLDRDTLRGWVKVGGFSGAQIFLDNFIYVVMVCLMVNAVSESGNYWVANSFIWSWLLVPVAALSEIVRRDYSRGVTRVRTYLSISAIIVLIWAVTVPLWRPLFAQVFMVDDLDTVLGIVYSLVPFYIAYIAAAIIDSIFLSMGRTDYLFVISIVVNIIYYGALYLLFVQGMVEASLEFIILMFGFGMVVHAILSMILLIRFRGKLKSVESGCADI